MHFYVATLILLLFFATEPSKAQEHPTQDQEAGVTGCTDCKETPAHGLVPLDVKPPPHRPFISMAGGRFDITGFPLSPEFASEGANCSRYIGSDPNDPKTYQRIGRTGMRIVKEITGNGESTPRANVFLSNNIPGMEKLCANWKNMGQVGKVQFYVWFAAAVAHDEGTCTSNVVNGNATNGMAAGELQVPENIGLRDWRGRGCKGNYGPVEAVEINKETGEKQPAGLRVMANAANYVPCFVEMFGNSLCGLMTNLINEKPKKCDPPGTAPKPIVGEHHSFRYLRRFGSQKDPGNISKNDILRLVRQFPLCKNSSEGPGV